MTPTSVQLWERIHSTELATPNECRIWATEISKSAPADCLVDPTKLAAELIRLGKITSFQANVLFRDLQIPLAIGTYRICESLESKLGPNWFQAMDVSRPKDSASWGYLLTSQSLQRSELRSWPPSLDLANKHAAVIHPSIDRWLFSGIDKSSLVALCEAIKGQPLTALLINRPLSWAESAGMVEQIATGLQKMHDSGLVHGCICPDAIWCVDEGEFVLRRDPLFPPANPYLKEGNSVLGGSKEVQLAVAAPELTLPNAAHSFQTDLYALGCVWYRSLMRCSPYSDATHNSPQFWAKAHTAQVVNPLNKSELPEPLQLCLAHLLAKNLSARFASAAELIKAIGYAVDESEKQSLEKSKTIQPLVQKPAIVPAIPTGMAIEKPVIEKPAIEKPVIEKPVIEKAAIAKRPISDLPTNSTPVGNVPSPAIPKAETQAGAPKKKHSDQKKSTGKKKSKKKKKPVWVLPAIIGGACLFFGLVITLLIRGSGSTTPVNPSTSLASSEPSLVNREDSKTVGSGQSEVIRRDSNTQKKPSESVSEYFAVESDDGQLLWAPPQAGFPFSLEMFPAGLEAMVFVSGNVWHDRGIASGIGKWWIASQPELAKHLSTLPLVGDDRINSIAIALYPGKKPGVPQAVFRVSYAQPVSIDSVTQALSGFSLQLFDPKSNLKKGLWSNESQSNTIAIVMDEMQTDSAALVKRAVVGPQELIATLPELNGGPAPLRRQLETLLKTTDSRADLTLLFAPSFLFGDGRELFAAVPNVQKVLRESIDESMQAIAFTTTVEPRWYLEMRMLGSETRDAGKFASAMKSRFLTIPDDFEKGLASGKVLDPYWRALGLRYPQMMRALNRFGRFGLEDGQVVANAYLPTDAMNNIVIASWMAFQNYTSQTVSNVATARIPVNKPTTKPMEEILESKITIGFEQESLEAALQLISSEVTDSVLAGSPISMTINGAAFQKEGITRNQSIRSFKHNGVPLRIVLTDLVRRANPVTTVQSPTERNQKVVWLLLEDADRPGQRSIELTTRNWSEANKISLPKEFVAE